MRLFGFWLRPAFVSKVIDVSGNKGGGGRVVLHLVVCVVSYGGMALKLCRRARGVADGAQGVEFMPAETRLGGPGPKPKPCRLTDKGDLEPVSPTSG